MRYQICNIIEGNCGFIIIVKLDHRGLQKNDLIIVARVHRSENSLRLEHRSERGRPY